MWQLSAIIECADAAHGLAGLVVGDGGCTCPGDVAKVSRHENLEKAKQKFMLLYLLRGVTPCNCLAVRVEVA